MSKKLYVGNLPFSITAEDLRNVFGEYGVVTSAQVATDRETGRSRGFGFVEMANGGDSAIENMNGSQMQGRTLTVNEARPREDRPRAAGPRRSSGGYGGGNGGGGYGRRW
jgi:RNA recognition motif-containing protein